LIGRILRLLFALPVALAVAAGLYYYWFSSFLNQKCDGCVGDQTRVAEAPSRLPDWVEEIGAYCDCGWRLTFPNTSNSYTRSDKATPTAPEPVKCDEDCNPSRVKIAEDALQLMSAARSPADNFLAPLYPKACRAKAASGAVTVDWVVLTGAVVGLALVIGSVVRGGINTAATNIASSVTSSTTQTTTP